MDVPPPNPLMEERVKSLETELSATQSELDAARAELKSVLEAQARSRERGVRAASFLSLWALRIFAGRLLYKKSRDLWDAFSEWVRNRRAERLEPASRDFAAALLNRLLRISLLGLIVALLPTALLIAQTFLISQQNRIISAQNELLGRQFGQMEKQSGLLVTQTEASQEQNRLLGTQNLLLGKQDERLETQNLLLGNQNDFLNRQDQKLAYQNDLFDTQNDLLGEQNKRIVSQLNLLREQNSKLDLQNSLIGFEQTTRFRDLLHTAPLKINVDADAGRQASAHSERWPPPRMAAVRQIVLLGEVEPRLVVRSLLPLLEDSDTSVSSGALVATQYILRSEDARVRSAALSTALLNIKAGASQLSVFGHRVNLRGASMEQIELNAAQLSSALFGIANMDGILMQRADLRGAEFDAQSSLREAVLSGSDLSGADMKGVNLTRAYFGFTSVSDNSPRGEPMLPTNLNDADLRSAILVDASFRWACMRAAQLADAQLNGARFEGTDLRGAEAYQDGNIIIITKDFLKKSGAFFDENTLFGPIPAGMGLEQCPLVKVDPGNGLPLRRGSPYRP